MKRFTAFFLLIAVTLLSLSSCSINGAMLNGKTPEELYTKILNEARQYDNYTVTGTQSFTVMQNGEESRIKQSFTAMFDVHNMYMKSGSDDVPSSAMEVWYVDNIYYLKQTDLLYLKAVIPYALYIESFVPSGSEVEDVITDIPKEWFKGSRFVSTESGDHCVDITVSGEDYKEYFNAVSPEDIGFDMEFSDITYKIYFDARGNLRRTTIEAGCSADGISVNAVMTSYISNIGTTSIKAPARTEPWTDITDDLDMILSMIGNSKE